MYNDYPRDSECWWAMKEAIDAEQEIDDAVGSVTNTFENIISQLDTAINDREEMELERNQLQEDLDALKEKYETLEAGVDLKRLIDLLTELGMAASAIGNYATDKLVYLRELNDVQKSDSDSSDGAAGDAGS